MSLAPLRRGEPLTEHVDPEVQAVTEERRRFEDADGNAWEIRTRADFKWHFVPVGGDGRARRIVTPQPDVDDPSDLSEEELRRLLEAGIPAEGISEPLEPSGDGS